MTNDKKPEDEKKPEDVGKPEQPGQSEDEHGKPIQTEDGGHGDPPGGPPPH